MAETTDGLHCAEALDGGFDAGEEFIESLARVDDVLYDEGGAAQDSQWSSSSRSWGRGDSPSCHPDASFTATSSSYGHSIPSLATSGTNATLWSGESSASHAPDSMRHATQVTAANGVAAAAHNTLTAGLGNSQTNCPPTSSSHGRPIPSHATSATSATMPSGRTFDSFDWSLGEDDEERGSNQLQPARMPHRAAYQLSQHDSEHGVSLLAGLHSAQAPRQDTAAANEGAAAAIFPEGQDDPDIDTRVDVELRNLRALYTSDDLLRNVATSACPDANVGRCATDIMAMAKSLAYIPRHVLRYMPANSTSASTAPPA